MQLLMVLMLKANEEVTLKQNKIIYKSDLKATLINIREITPWKVNDCHRIIENVFVHVYLNR